MKYLVIVESPSKCKKIEQYLNEFDHLNIYEVVATMGHITELTSLQNIDINNNFQCNYEIIKSKKQIIELIKTKIKNVDEVILACDNDREGEAINYHICKQFNLPLTTKRIIFNEITEKAIQYAILNPQNININVVYAQQARQILDLLVGFKVTPLLWKFISSSKKKVLSAGRCQTPALKIIYDNYQNNNKLEERKIYNVSGYFTNLNISFELNKVFEDEYDVNDFFKNSINFNHIYTCSLPKKVIKIQPSPYITSTLQQAASNIYGFSPKETMQIAQNLYEAGYITYMRTNNKKYSSVFVNSVQEFILRKYNNNKYINQNLNKLICEIQTDNHEAIRPTNISLLEPSKEVNLKEKHLYKLIWENALESCMSPAVYNSVTAQISAYNNSRFTHTSEQLDFSGWTIVSQKQAYENKVYQYLQTIKQNDIINYKKIVASVSLQGLTHHYTEAKLVQLLEEKGIGRPSTFSTLVDKIQERDYVKKKSIKGKEILCKNYELINDNIFEITTSKVFGKEKDKLIIQPLGIIVMEFLNKYLSSIFNYNYTEEMENTLDKISKGEYNFIELCNNCNIELDNIIDNLKNENKTEIQIDENNTYIIGKYGPVLKCFENINGTEETTFKAIKQDIDFNKIQNGEYNAEDIIDINAKKKQYNLGKYEDNDVILKKGKYGLYVCINNTNISLKELGNRPIENITFEEIMPYIIKENTTYIREISKNITLRNGPKGPYIFYKTTKMKKPQFFNLNDFKDNYKSCDVNIIKKWINETYNIS